MAYAVSTTTGADVTGGVGETAGNAAAAAAGEKTVAELQAEVEAQTKRANEGYKTLRKRDEEQHQLRERIDKNERDMADLRASIKGGGAATTQASGEDLEPNADEEPIKWIQWNRRQEKRENDQRIAQMQAQSEADRLNTFALTSEAAAKQKYPDYDQAMPFLVEDYKKELKTSGELDLAIDEMLADQRPEIRNALSRTMAEKGVGEREAAEDLVARSAFEYRRQRIVRAAAKHGGNPAEQAYELAKHRGWKGAQGTARPTTVDSSLAEMERKRKLAAGTQTLSGVHDGGEPADTRIWTYPELRELERTNPAEFRKVTRAIAAGADENPDLLNQAIRH